MTWVSGLDVYSELEEREQCHHRASITLLDKNITVHERTARLWGTGHKSAFTLLSVKALKSNYLGCLFWAFRQTSVGLKGHCHYDASLLLGGLVITK